MGVHPHRTSPLLPRGATSPSGAKSYVKTPPLAKVAVPRPCSPDITIVWELCRGGGLLLGTQGGGRTVKGTGMSLSFSQFLSISRSGPPMAGRSAHCLSPRPRENISRVLFYLAGNNFWLHRSAHKFSLGNVVQIKARRQCTACTPQQFNSIDTCRASPTHQEQLWAPGGIGGGGEGQASERGKPRSQVPASPERRASRTKPAPL